MASYRISSQPTGLAIPPRQPCSKVLADILLALDNGDLAMLTLLDLSAAFDSVDHTTLLECLRVSYGLNDVVLS